MSNFKLNKGDESSKDSKFNLNKGGEPVPVTEKKDRFSLNKNAETSVTTPEKKEKFSLNKSSDVLATQENKQENTPNKANDQNQVQSNVAPTNAKPGTPVGSTTTKKKNKAWWIILLIIVVLALLLFFLLKNNGGKTIATSVDTPEAELVDNQIDKDDIISEEKTQAEEQIGEGSQPIGNDGPAKTQKTNSTDANDLQSSAPRTTSSSNSTTQTTGTPVSISSSKSTSKNNMTTSRSVSPTTANGSVEEEAWRTIRGDYGNGADRKEALGSRYDEIQAKVNEFYREGKVL